MKSQFNSIRFGSGFDSVFGFVFDILTGISQAQKINAGGLAYVDMPETTLQAGAFKAIC